MGVHPDKVSSGSANTLAGRDRSLQSSIYDSGNNISLSSCKSKKTKPHKDQPHKRVHSVSSSSESSSKSEDVSDTDSIVSCRAS